MESISFGTGGWRAVIGEGFVKDNIQRIACAQARRMKEENCAESGLCIGYDRRFLSREAAIWFSCTMAAEGVKVWFINLAAPTPQVMYTVMDMGLKYGAAVTASHNPAVYNGIKLFTADGRDADQTYTDALQKAANELKPEEIREIDFDTALKEGKISFIDPRDRYLDSIMDKINLTAIRGRKLRIVLDPMYGVSLTGLMTILYTARCDVNIINDRHDAFFGGHLPAPNEETLADLQAEVRERHADVGMATDGDADRLGIIDEKSRYITANEVLVLLYHYLLKYKGWHGPAVRNLATTHLLDRVAERFGEQCYEVPVGFKHISAAMDAHDALIGGESSGGLTVRGHIHGKDGLYAASLLVEAMAVTGKPISALIDEIYQEYGEAHMAEYDWHLTPKAREEIGRTIMEEKKLPDYPRKIEKISYMDGCKVYFDDGWIIIRFSGTEPRIRVFAEAPTLEAARETVRLTAEYLELTFKE